MAFQLSPEWWKKRIQQAAQSDESSSPGQISVLNFVQYEEKKEKNILKIFLSLFYYFAKKLAKFDFVCLVVSNAAGAKLYSS